MIRILAISDLHGQLPDIPPCDLLLIAGDICPDGSKAFQAKWLDTSWRNWLEKIPAKEVVAVAGNHDRLFEKDLHLIPKDLRWHYLQDSSIILFGLKIYGTPWQLPFWGAFNLSDKLLETVYEKIPDGIDIVISHGPPFGLFDEVPSYLETPLHTGSLSLRRRLLKVKPKLVVFGHIHCSFGQTNLEDVLFANVSLLNNEMEMVHSPVAFSFEISPLEINRSNIT
jgi:Icc-related predicted phosphoesterase